MEELVQVMFEEPSTIKLTDSGIRVIKDRTILAAGFWNGRHYSLEEIEKCFHNTDWEDKDVISLIADHQDDDMKGRPLTLRDWLGFTSNHYLTKDGKIKADLNICNNNLAVQLIDGKAPFGISPFVFGKYDSVTKSQIDFIIKNNAIVVEPACKESYINAYLGDDGRSEEISKLSNEERINCKLGETTTEDVQGKDLDAHGLQPVKTKKKKKKSDSIQLKGGKKNMEENEKVEENTEKVEEVSAPVEEVKEKVEEPIKEDAEVMKEDDAEHEEESEDKLMEQLVKITEKLMKKRKMTPEQAKMQKLESEIVSLRKEMIKLQEEKSEEPEEKKEDSEKLSARPRTMARTDQSEEGFTMFKKGSNKGSHELASMLGY